MARKKPEPESHLIDGIGPQEPEVSQDSQPESTDIITALQADNIRLSGELESLKRRFDAVAALVWNNWGKVI